MDEITRKRLEWVAQAVPGMDWPPGLFGALDSIGNGWGEAMTEMAKGALAAIPQWRPIAEAPIPGPDAVTEYWSFPCLLQTSKGIVGEGFARYATDNRVRGRKHIRVLRWYMGANDRPRDNLVCKDPLYFMPLPQPRKD